jgi:hypothetical protein
MKADDRQLAFDFDVAENGNGDLRERIRELVAEEGMSAEEVDAVIADALDQLGWNGAPAPTRAEPCECERPLILTNPWLGRSCTKCGRRPA